MEEQTKQEWLMPSDIKEYETRNPEEMLNKYLARPVVKKWREDFKDEETGEIVSIERNEVLFNAGTMIDQDVLVKLRFSMEAEDIGKVWVSENPPMSERMVGQSKHIVSITSGMKTMKVYVNGCNTAEDAAQLVEDYHKVYGIENVSRCSFWITESKVTDGIYAFDEDVEKYDPEPLDMYASIGMEQMRQKVDKEIPLPESVVGNKVWTLKVNRWIAYAVKEKWVTVSHTYHISAFDPLSAITRLRSYLYGKTERNVFWSFNSVSSGKVDFAIPKEYVKTWEEKHYGR